MKLARVFFSLILLITAVAALGAAILIGRLSTRQSIEDSAVAALDSHVGDDDRMVRFTVHPGESAAEIAGNLEAAGLITSASRFSLIARIRGSEDSLRAGDYALRRNMTTTEVLDHLTDGKTIGGITVREGWRIVEIADALQKNGLAKRDDFVDEAMHGTFQGDFLDSRPDGASVEGYLFPDTYEIMPGTSAHDVVQMMLDNFGKRFTPEMRATATKRGMTIHQVVTLASIVEREAAVSEERPIVASVFLNRIQRGMRLQTDPSVQYAVAGLEPPYNPDGYWKSVITNLDTAVSSPYNTYQNTGWPPGPIASPGLASIEAALSPAQTDFLYFVARNDGRHAFSRTLKEHNDNVAKYQGG